MGGGEREANEPERSSRSGAGEGEGMGSGEVEVEVEGVGRGDEAEPARDLKAVPKSDGHISTLSPTLSSRCRTGEERGKRKGKDGKDRVYKSHGGWSKYPSEPEPLGSFPPDRARPSGLPRTTLHGTSSKTVPDAVLVKVEPSLELVDDVTRAPLLGSDLSSVRLAVPSPIAVKHSPGSASLPVDLETRVTQA